MKIDLTNEEALVLFEWLNNNAKRDELFQHKSEQYVFWNIECQLEKSFREPHSINYEETLASARAQLERKQAY